MRREFSSDSVTNGSIFPFFLVSEGIFFGPPLIPGRFSRINLFRRGSGQSQGLPRRFLAPCITKTASRTGRCLASHTCNKTSNLRRNIRLNEKNDNQSFR